MDEPNLLAAARYVELNPVRAKLAKRPGEWAWSSASAHLAGRDDGLVKVAPLLERAGDWQAFLESGLDDPTRETLRSHERTGRPLGNVSFVEGLEARLGRALARRKPGPQRKAADNGKS